jgi:putative heme iron utilization protein
VNEKKDVLRETDAEAIRLAKTLIRTARHATIATLEPGSGRPLATRVGVSTDIDGTPVIFVSALSAHTPALRNDPRCSLLFGEPGRGDPLAHARISVHADAREIENGSDEHKRISWRYLTHQPKAQLYAALPDFRYFRLEPVGASLNAGFGRAYALTAEQVLTESAVADELAAAERGAIDHMNEDHPDAVALYARHYAKAADGTWTLIGVDAEGMELANGDEVRRVFFETPLMSAGDMHTTMVRMAGEARQGLAETGTGAKQGN